MYESKATTTTIKAESKITIKIRDNFYSVTFTEERSVPDVEGVNVESERAILFDDVNKVVDSQAAEIINTFSKK